MEKRNEKKELTGLFVSQMIKLGFCAYCGLSNHRFLKTQPLRCQYHDLKSLNHYKIEQGRCPLSKEDLRRISMTVKPSISKKIKEAKILG